MISRTVNWRGKVGEENSGQGGVGEVGRQQGKHRMVYVEFRTFINILNAPHTTGGTKGTCVRGSRTNPY